MNQICGYLGYTGYSNKFDFDRRDRGIIIHSGGKIEELVGKPFLSVKFRKYREEKFRVFTHRKKHINIVRIISNPGVHGGNVYFVTFFDNKHDDEGFTCS